jgi:hypothetical protein
MGVSQNLVRLVRSTLRAVVLPGMTILLVLGVTSGGRGAVSVTPAPSKIASELYSHERLPAGTALSMGTKADAMGVRVDGDGRLVFTTPRMTRFGGLVSAGVGEAQRLAASNNVGVPADLTAAARH